MTTFGYWKRLLATACLVMVTGFWFMNAFAFTIPTWLVVLASTLGILLGGEWLAGRLHDYEFADWMRPVGLAVLTLVGYGLLTRFDFLPSSALLLAVVIATSLFDLVLGDLLAHTEKPSVQAAASRV